MSVVFGFRGSAWTTHILCAAVQFALQKHSKYGAG